MDWLWTFPQLDEDSMRTLRMTIDDFFRGFTRTYGDAIQQIFEPLRYFLIQSEWLMLNTPWFVVIFVIAALAWLASRKWTIVLGSVITLLLIGYFGMWEDTMRTVSMIFVCTVISLVLGIPIGIVMARSNRVQSIISPVLDVMQTLPELRLSYSRRDVAGDWQGSRSPRRGDLRDPANNPADESGHSPG